MWHPATGKKQQQHSVANEDASVGVTVEVANEDASVGVTVENCLPFTLVAVSRLK